MSHIESLVNFTQWVDEIDTDENKAPKKKIHRLIRVRRDLFSEFEDTKFRHRYRLSRADVLTLFGKIESEITLGTDNRNSPISPINRLLITLRYYATGSFQMTLSDIAWVHKSTVCRIIRNVIHAIASLKSEFVKMPQNAQEVKQVKKEFFNYSKFPCVIGAIDCSHVPIIRPPGLNSELFRNRKGYFSINVQCICDSQLRFMNIVARWHGSSSIYNQSAIRGRLENNEFDGYLLGDAGYECTKYLLTPLSNPVTPAERAYNISHIKARNSIERCFGVWKKRFPYIGQAILLKLETTLAVIVATSVLHNICCKSGDIAPPEPHEDGILQRYEQPPVIFEGRQSQISRSVQRSVIQNVFQLLAAKTYYFGVGGGTRLFESLVEEEGVFSSTVCWKCSTGVHREILKLKFKDVT